MLLAQHLKQTNIAAYVLYLWQMEDLLRAINFDTTKAKAFLIKESDNNEEDIKNTELWIESLVEMMHKEKVETSGHIQVVINVMNEIEEFHQQLLRNNDGPYIHAFILAQPNIISYKAKSSQSSRPDTHVCFEAMYWLMLARLSKKEASPATVEAIETMSKMLDLLSKRYNEELKKTDF
jgi:hypothetical protein